MWTFSISATGTRDNALALLNAQTCPETLNVDGADAPFPDADRAAFEAAKSAAIAAVTALPANNQVDVSVSGNANLTKPIITATPPPVVIEA